MKRKVKIKYYEDVRTYGVFINRELIATTHNVSLAVSIAKDYAPNKIIITDNGRLN